MLTLYLSAISDTGCGNRKANEAAALDGLLERAFGFKARLLHHPDGAPYIDGHPEIHISISHSAATYLLAVSDAPVGVDIEAPRRQLTRVASKFLTAGERGRMDLTSGDHTEELLHYWTAKEAAFKLLRVPGLTVSAIEVSADMTIASACGKECGISYERHGEELMAIACLTGSHS